MSRFLFNWAFLLVVNTMAGQTYLTYNGITLRNVLTQQFRQEAVYDQSGADLMYHKFTIRVVGYLHVDDTLSAPLATLGISESVLTAPIDGVASIIAGVDGDAAEKARRVGAALLQPRMPFSMEIGRETVGGVVVSTPLLFVEPHPDVRVLPQPISNYDVANGPKPRALIITGICNSTSFRVEFEIEINALVCEGDANNDSGILSNRWSMTDQIDSNRYTVRTISGRLVTSNGYINPHGLRSWVVPRLQPGFKRKSMRFTVTADALNLDYEIIDEEIAHAAPYPATSWSYRYTETSGDARLCQSSVEITLDTHRDTDKKRLFAVAIAIIDARLGTHGDNGSRVDELQLVDEYGDGVNRVSARCTVTRGVAGTVGGDSVANTIVGAVGGGGAAGGQKGMAALLVHNLGRPITKDDLAGVDAKYDRNLSLGARDGDRVQLTGPIPITSAWMCLLQSPCSDEFRSIESQDVAETDNEDGDSNREDYVLDAQIVEELPEQPVKYLSPDHRSAIYTTYRMENRYQYDEHRIALPRAGQMIKYQPGVGTEPTQDIVTLGLPTQTRVIRVIASRIGEPPKLPEPKREFYFGRGKAHLIKRAVIATQPDRTKDGKQIIEIGVEYHYSIDVPLTEKEKLPLGKSPWEDPAFSSHLLDGTKAFGGVIE